MNELLTLLPLAFVLAMTTDWSKWSVGCCCGSPCRPGQPLAGCPNGAGFPYSFTITGLSDGTCYITGTPNCTSWNGVEFVIDDQGLTNFCLTELEPDSAYHICSGSAREIDSIGLCFMQDRIILAFGDADAQAGGCESGIPDQLTSYKETGLSTGYDCKTTRTLSLVSSYAGCSGWPSTIDIEPTT